MTDDGTDKSSWTAQDYLNYAATGKVPASKQEGDDVTDDGDFGGLTYQEFKRHPIRKLLNNVQAGHTPPHSEIQDLGLGSGSRQRLEGAIDELQKLRDAGENGEAHKRFDALAADVVAHLPKEQRDPTHWGPEDDTPSDPAALADRVSRW